jgi:hypothetical protein
MSSAKTKVIDYLFDLKPSGEILSDDIVEAIKVLDLPLSTSNPANFLKDLIRADSANKNWPTRLTARKVTARQIYGKRRVFEFVPFKDNQIVPFPVEFSHEGAKEHHLTTLGLSRMSREFACSDETWVAGLVADIRLIETQLSLFSPHRLLVGDVAMLQIGKKKQPEIDLLYAAEYMDGCAAISCEIKREGERILPDQIRAQVDQALTISPRFHMVVPVAIQPVRIKGDAAIHVIEFDRIGRNEPGKRLQVVNQMIYNLSPAIPGLL